MGKLMSQVMSPVMSPVMIHEATIFKTTCAILALYSVV
jgi:hypothetical protein